MKIEINWDFTGKVRALAIRLVPQSEQNVRELEESAKELEEAIKSKKLEEIKVVITGE